MYKNRQGKHNGNYRHGRTLKVVYCVDCGKQLSKNAYYYGYTRCLSCSNSLKNSGKNHPNYGKKASPELRRKLSISLGGTGIPYEKVGYGPAFNAKLKESVRVRDGRVCQLCNCTEEENGQALDVHHIDYNKRNNNETNLVSLCISCHRKTNHKNRVEWTKILRK